MIISIDPGLTGAIAYFGENGDLRGLIDMPVSAKTNGKGNQINAYVFADLLSDWGSDDLVVIERVHAMPGQGVTSVFGFGRSLGVLEGVIAANKIPIEWVTPQAWKKHFGLLKKDKDAARTLCIEKYPSDAQTLFKRKKDIGRADAVLIGLYHLNRIARAA